VQAAPPKEKGRATNHRAFDHVSTGFREIDGVDHLPRPVNPANRPLNAVFKGTPEELRPLPQARLGLNAIEEKKTQTHIQVPTLSVDCHNHLNSRPEVHSINVSDGRLRQ